MDITLGRVLTAASVVVLGAIGMGMSIDSMSTAEMMSAGLALLGAGHLAE